MVQHISVRVPWHDHGWDGTVCAMPEANNACLRLKNISENKDDQAEASICGKCMADYAERLSCISEGSAFMSPVEMVKTTIHPYKKSNPGTHGHFLPTEVVYPSFSFPARPFAWLMKENIEQRKEAYGIDYQPGREPALSFKTTWVQDAENHRAIFDYFYRDVIENESLCIAYAKQVPFVEDTRRVIIGMGHVKKIMPAVEHKHTDEGGLRSMVWETMVCHSIREDHEDGFIIPYQEMMDYAEKHPEFDMASITVFAPEDAFSEFSYATEHVEYDTVIDVIQSCIKAFEIINDCLDEDYSNVLTWLNYQLAQVWEERGAFPGLGAMLCAMEIPQGIMLSKQIHEQAEEGSEDLWAYLDKVMAAPNQYLDTLLSRCITPIIQKTWRNMPDERRTLFKLLSRFALSIEQATILFQINEREKRGIKCSDRDIIENPYLIYEQTRLMQDPLFVSIRKVDRAVFPVPSILEKYPLNTPTALTSDNDERRVRAIAVAVLEHQVEKGNTIMPCNMMVDDIRDMILEPACKVTQDILDAINSFLKKEILRREMKDGTEYYKLDRINAFDEIIEKRISKRLRASRLEVNANWRQLLDARFGKITIVDDKPDDEEERARKEKAAVLAELAGSRIGVLVGDAGTGKTTVLSVLCEQRDIQAGGVLLLAPTGKVTVRLKESMKDLREVPQAMNVAQFLARSKRFDGREMRYQLSNIDDRDIPETVIIDEASMLTEEMFGALMQALKPAKRIIFVGDPNQLPPIGAGRPFVDLVHLLRMNLRPGVFPMVCASYGQLTVNRRQGDGSERLDVEMSKLFTNTEDEVDEGIVSEIEKSGSDHIAFSRWDTKEELENKLLQIVSKELGMADVDDQEGFDLALGGTKLDHGVFFNRGCAASAEAWQILAPVRNMPQGVMNINRLFHLKYREKLLGVSKRDYYRRIPKALGPEGIIYGDKVINVINKRRDGWNDRVFDGYVANGEIGIACGCYSTKRVPDYLRIEFASQQGCYYSFTKSDFDDESGAASLELAYALTVHKAQGSQFDTVILIIAEPCLLISRELLYTALTRQRKKIIILYNQEAYHLLKYASAANSDIARRFTDLFADVYHEESLDMRPQIVKAGEHFYEDKLVHRTAKGELVRSKSEVIIANALFYKGVQYTYEPEIILEGKIKRPDFQIRDDDTGEMWYWEHCGMMDDPKYKKRWEDKKAFYKKNGIEEGKNLIVTYDVNGAVDSQEVDRIISDILDM